MWFLSNVMLVFQYCSWHLHVNIYLHTIFMWDFGVSYFASLLPTIDMQILFVKHLSFALQLQLNNVDHLK